MADARDIVAGARMPSHAGIGRADDFARAVARAGSDALRDRILAYYAKHHPDSPLGRATREAAAAAAARARFGFTRAEEAA